MIYFFLADGLEETELIAALDLVKRAGIFAKTVSVTGQKAVTGTHGIIIQADAVIKEVNFDDAEMLVLPGGMPGTKNLENCTLLKEAVLSFAQDGKWLAAICAAPSIFGKLGLLKGKRATCFPGYEKSLKGAEMTDLPAVTDGKIITGKAMGCVFEFGFEIIKALKGEMTAKDVLRGICYEK